MVKATATVTATATNKEGYKGNPMKKIKSVPVVQKKMVEVEEVVGVQTTTVEEPGGLSELHGKCVIIQCMNYHYAGLLSGINATCLELSDAGIVFDTGSFTAKKFANYQKVHSGKLFVQLSAIESFWEIPDTYLK